MSKSGGMYKKSGSALQKMIRESGMVAGNQTKGGVRFGPKTSSGKSGAFGGGYGAGMGSTSSGSLGPRQRVAPTKRGNY